jgi:hypothetical protein
MDINEMNAKQEDGRRKNMGVDFSVSFWGWRWLALADSQSGPLFLTTAAVSPYFRNCQRHQLQVIVG